MCFLKSNLVNMPLNHSICKLMNILLNFFPTLNILILLFVVTGGAFVGVQDTISPFGYKRGEGVDAGAGEIEWVVNKDRYKYDSMFDSLGPSDGKLTGSGKILFIYSD